MIKSLNTKCFYWKLSKVNGCRTEMVYVGKAKMRMRSGTFFNFWKFVYIFQLFVYNCFKKSTAFQTHFGFSNTESKLHRFWCTVSNFDNFQSGYPVQCDLGMSSGLIKAIFEVWPTMGLGRIILAQAQPSLWIWKLERPVGPNCGPWAKFFQVFSKNFKEFHILCIPINHITWIIV